MNAAEDCGAARRPVVLVVPTYNEQDAIAAALAGVPRAVVDRIIVADGGSTDGTAARARGAGADVLDCGRGYGRACWLGALAAPENAIVVFMDGDGSDPADRLPALVAPIVAGTHDFVIASRVRGVRERGSMGWHQVLAGRVMGALIGLRYGVGYTDMCAFRAIRRDHLMALGMREMSYGWNLEMQMRAVRGGLRVLEIPVPYALRTAGDSKVSGNLKGGMKASGQLLRAFCRVAFGKG